MRPTHIIITGKSKFTYNKEIQPVIMENHGHLIQKLATGSIIVLSDRVQTADDVESLIAFLLRRGIQRADIG